MPISGRKLRNSYAVRNKNKKHSNTNTIDLRFATTHNIFPGKPHLSGCIKTPIINIVIVPFGEDLLYTIVTAPRTSTSAHTNTQTHAHPKTQFTATPQRAPYSV